MPLKLPDKFNQKKTFFNLLSNNYVIAIVLLLIHIPFINADPFVLLDNSRGAFTDEGLYLYQISNYLKGFGFDINGSDGFLKTPIYNLLVAPFHHFFGILGVRFICLFYFIIAVLQLLKNSFFRYKLLVILLILSLPTIFFHIHLAMAEILAISFLIISFQTLFSVQLDKKYWSLVYFLFAIGCKIQFAYLLFLLPLYIIYLPSLSLNKHRRALVIILLLVLSTLIFLILNWQSYCYIISNQSQGKFQEFGHLLLRLKINLTFIFQNIYNKLFLIFFLLLLSAYLFLSFSKKIKFKPILLLLGFWLLIESHKLFLIYLPQRYLFSWFCAIGLLFYYLFYEILSFSTKSKFVLLGINIILFFACIYQYLFYTQTINHQVNNAQEIVKKYAKNSTVIAGPWAPSLGLDLPNKTSTAWFNYYENTTLWNNENSLIIAETNFADNDSVFIKRLDAKLQLIMIDSFIIKDWKIGVFKLTQITPKILVFNSEAWKQY